MYHGRGLTYPLKYINQKFLANEIFWHRQINTIALLGVPPFLPLAKTQPLSFWQKV